MLCGAMTGCLLALTLAVAALPQAQTEKQPAWTPEEKQLADKASNLDAEAFKLFQMGKIREAADKVAESLALRQRLYPPERFPDGHPDLAINLTTLGVFLQSLGDPANALTYHKQALAMFKKLYPPERFKNGHPYLAISLTAMGAVLKSLGEPAKALSFVEEALAMYKKLYPPERFKDGHPEVAISLDSMGFVLQSLGEPAKALTYYEQALAMRRKLYPPERFKDGHPELAISLILLRLVFRLAPGKTKDFPLGERLNPGKWLVGSPCVDQHCKATQKLHGVILNNMGGVLQSLGQAANALTYHEQALAMRQRLYPPERFKDGHPDLAISLSNMGGVLHSLGELAKALTYFEQALAMRRKLYPPARFPDGHPELAICLDDVGSVLESLGEPGKALTYSEQALAMFKKLYPPGRFKDGHPDLAASLHNMGSVLKSLGEPAKALSYFEQALAMNQRLYPPQRRKDGHPRLAQGLNSMGLVLESLGQPAKALTYVEQALVMFKKLYPPERFPDGHPQLAQSLGNKAHVMLSLGESAEALTYFEQALAMHQKLYPPERFPDGHPHLATSLNNMGFGLLALRERAKAVTYFEQALVMCQKLYPAERFKDGHPHLATDLNNMGIVLDAVGEPAKALTYVEQALVVYRKVALREMNHASEASALAYQLALLPTRDGYLSLAMKLTPSSSTYKPLWHTRGGMLPLLQARHQRILALTLTSGQVRDDYAKLVSVRQQISRWQSQVPNDEAARKERDKQLADLNDQLDQLERKLVAAVPALEQIQELADKGPADLAKALPKNSSFVDCFRYRHTDPQRRLRGLRYIAFVVVPDKEAIFVPLGDAQPIDDAVAAWRKHIDVGEDSLAPAKLRTLVWDKLAKHLPPGTKQVYLCPDGDLARLPFAALPGSKPGTILLEDHYLAIVPSGPWLLQQLLYPPDPVQAPENLLAVGGVAYGQPPGKAQPSYPPLAGTARELKGVLQAFGKEAGAGLSGESASTAAVRDKLTKVAYAHFATHGFFDEKSLSSERERLQQYLAQWSFQTQDKPLAGLGLRNPAGYVGLVLAGANDPAHAGADGGILTGLQVVDLPLEKLRLCVLSACETGLGALTEAEGVLGLQRAFHAAGCGNVVGSLWKVDDEATAALMVQFYHELLVNNRPPIEALGEAQLALYRHPELIPALAGSRGPIDQAKAVKVGSKAAEPNAGAKSSRAPAKLWAAFVLSGLGQ
jgi:tetratricopeptide (TPR) repeat protein/CHAT domain-containing protein